MENKPLSQEDLQQLMKERQNTTHQHKWIEQWDGQVFCEHCAIDYDEVYGPRECEE